MPDIANVNGLYIDRTGLCDNCGVNYYPLLLESWSTVWINHVRIVGYWKVLIVSWFFIRKHFLRHTPGENWSQHNSLPISFWANILHTARLFDQSKNLPRSTKISHHHNIDILCAHPSLCLHSVPSTVLPNQIIATQLKTSVFLICIGFHRPISAPECPHHIQTVSAAQSR